MENKSIITVSSMEQNNAGYKVIEVNMSDATESLYAVCTPIKKQ